MGEIPTVRVVTGEQRGRWDAFVGSQPTGNLLQSWGWGELRRQLGWSVQRLALEAPRNGTWLAAVQILEQRLPLGVGWAYAPQGPVLADLDDTASCRLLLRAAAGRLRRQRVIQLKCDPEWPAGAVQTRRLRRATGMVAAKFDVQQRHTWLVDLPPDASELLGRLPSSTRRNVRTARAQGIAVERSSSRDAVERFYSLNVETLTRQQLSIRPLDYYLRAVESLGASVFVASSGNRPLSAAVAITLGQKLIYLYGGTSREAPHLRASYAMHMAVMEWGISRGARVYDMWGMPRRFDPSNPAHGYAVFKTRWGGRMADYGGLVVVPLYGGLDRWVHLAEAWLLRDRPLLR